MDDHAGRVTAFRAMHVPGNPVLLPNAWDPGSARVIVDAGFPALATTSGCGIARAVGGEDHERFSADEAFDLATRIVGSVDVPVTIDLEAGYGLAPEEFIERFAGTGAMGCNLEDTDHRAGRLRPIDEQAALIRGVREAATATGLDLFINARVDAFLPGRDGPDEGLDGALRRGAAYLDAGADGVYPIGAPLELIEELCRRLDGPVNAWLKLDGTSPKRYAELGVARLTLASGLWRFAMDAVVGALADLAKAP